MKKYIITLAIALGLVLNVSAQGVEYNRYFEDNLTDGFFSPTYDIKRNTEDQWGTMPTIFSHGIDYDMNAEATPVGSGLLLLAGMGLAYGIRRKSTRQ